MFSRTWSMFIMKYWIMIKQSILRDIMIWRHFTSVCRKHNFHWSIKKTHYYCITWTHISKYNWENFGILTMEALPHVSNFLKLAPSDSHFSDHCRSSSTVNNISLEEIKNDRYFCFIIQIILCLNLACLIALYHQKWNLSLNISQLYVIVFSTLRKINGYWYSYS